MWPEFQAGGSSPNSMQRYDRIIEMVAWKGPLGSSAGGFLYIASYKSLSHDETAAHVSVTVTTCISTMSP